MIALLSVLIMVLGVSGGHRFRPKLGTWAEAANLGQSLGTGRRLKVWAKSQDLGRGCRIGPKLGTWAEAEGLGRGCKIG